MSETRYMLDDLRPSNTFERKILEYLAAGGSLPVTVQHAAPDLSEVFNRLVALENRPVGQVAVPVQSNAAPADLTPMLDAIANVSERMATIERVVVQEGMSLAPAEPFDPAPLQEEIAALRSTISRKDEQLIGQERLLQAMAQVVDDLQQRVGVIEAIDITLVDERKAG